MLHCAMLHCALSIVQFVLLLVSSDESGDLTFEAGELIQVVMKDGDWWTGVKGARTGVFPFNYVEPAPQVSGTGLGV